MDEQKSELKKWLGEKREELLRDLADLVKIPSVAGPPEAGEKRAPFGRACREALERMRAMAERDGIPSTDHEGYCVSLQVGDGGREIGIWNHLDVVPAGEDWRYPPFALTVKGDLLIGRGAQDNKGPAAAVYYALRFCQEYGLLRNIRVRQILGCQEEAGMEDVRYYVEHEKVPDFSFVADCSFPVCCGEKGILRLTLQSTERLGAFEALQGGVAANSVPDRAQAVFADGEERVCVEAAGQSGHAAFPEGTTNAIGVLARKLVAYPWEEREKRAVDFLRRAASDGYGEGLGITFEDEASGKLTCNAGKVWMEDGFLKLCLDIRYPISDNAQRLLEILAEQAAACGLAITETHDDRPYYMEPEQPFVRLLMEAWREETGGKEQPYVMGGGTYARHIPRTVGFGTGMARDIAPLQLPPGHGGCHSADETESLRNLQKAICIYVNALTKLDKWSETGAGER